jgi:hypothetical protein
VNLINGAQPCNVFWQVGSSATLGTTTSFVGNILALSSVTLNNGVTLDGRALARNGSVTLINDTISSAQCATPVTTTGTGSGSGTGSGTGTTTGTGGGKGNGTARLHATPSSLTTRGSHVCVSKAFKVTVSGKLIRRVVFSFAGHVVATRTGAPFTASVPPGTGRHTLKAHVTFSGGTPAKTLHIPVRSCNAADRSVKPVVGSGGFTG